MYVPNGLFHFTKIISSNLHFAALVRWLLTVSLSLLVDQPSSEGMVQRIREENRAKIARRSKAAQWKRGVFIFSLTSTHLPRNFLFVQAGRMARKKNVQLLFVLSCCYVTSSVCFYRVEPAFHLEQEEEEEEKKEQESAGEGDEPEQQDQRIDQEFVSFLINSFFDP